MKLLRPTIKKVLRIEVKGGTYVASRTFACVNEDDLSDFLDRVVRVIENEHSVKDYNSYANIRFLIAEGRTCIKSKSKTIRGVNPDRVYKFMMSALVLNRFGLHEIERPSTVKVELRGEDKVKSLTFVSNSANTVQHEIMSVFSKVSVAHLVTEKPKPIAIVVYEMDGTVKKKSKTTRLYGISVDKACVFIKANVEN